jgi:hypothetical protein
VILFGIERKASGYATRTTDVFLTVESDQQGAARFDLQPTIGARSIYAAVDAVRGDYVISSPQPEAVNVSPAHMMRMKGKAGLEFEGFDLDSQWIEAICVRPGNGSWRVSMMDGSSVDESAVHGTVQVGAGRMKAIGNGPTSPVRFRPRDVLIAIDPYTMTVVATAVDE